MNGDIAVEDLPRTDFQDHQHIQSAESRCHDCGKIAGDKSTGVIVNERRSGLGRASSWAGTHILRPILLHRPRRHQDSQLERQFVGHPFLPQVGLLVAISTISCRMSFGSRGLPPRDSSARAAEMPSYASR
jgi:hypothetical protein